MKKNISILFILIIMMAANVGVMFNEKSDNNSFLSNLSMKAWAQEPENNYEYDRECFTGQKLRVTSIEVCGLVDVSVGDLLDSSVGLDACVEFEWVDCYKIDCYDGNTSHCTEYDWTVCASSGCPSICD